MTSVKDFRVESKATDSSLGEGSFLFTDRYSVFDWGEMPDRIPGKGATLCLMGAYNFELLEDEGIDTHYRGVFDDSNLCRLSDVSDPVTEMGIELTRVPDLPYGDGGYDYEQYFEEAGENYLIPLEVVFRNRVPEGSSLRRRNSPEDLGLDLEDWPEEAFSLDEPIVEFSTKYEEKDRYLSRQEAESLAGSANLDELESLARGVNSILCDRAELSGMTHDDGKIECLYYDGTIKVADVVGTFDENRFTFQGQQLSKEVIRQYYRDNQPEWIDALEEAKAASEDSDEKDWRLNCAVTPDPLPGDLLEAVSQMYRAGANTYTGYEWFDVPGLEDVLTRLNELV